MVVKGVCLSFVVIVVVGGGDKEGGIIKLGAELDRFIILTGSII
jgi:hypothetical protein